MNTVLEWYRNGGPVMNFILLVASSWWRWWGSPSFWSDSTRS
jgi:hypothetical protein